MRVYLDGRPAELPRRRPRGVVDEQRFAVPEAPAPGVHPAAQRSDGGLGRRDVVLFAVLVGLVPAALVVVVMLMVVAPVTTAFTWTHARHGAQRSGQLPPRPAADRFRPKTCRGAISAPCWETDSSAPGSFFTPKETFLSTKV